MSLLEDLVHVMRCVLEYFGVPQDMLVPVWESTLCGQYRSVVRMIGSNLPLTPYPRLHFQVPFLQTIRRQGHVEVSVDALAIPSLADVLWVADDEGDSCTKFRNSVPPRKHGRPHGFESTAAVCVRPVPAALREQKLHTTQASSTQPEALEKIQALEVELQKLRAQIALIVTTPTADGPLPCNPATPCTPFPAPLLTSTPFTAPPPPPPPPLPPSPGIGLAKISVTDVIRQRQAARMGKSGVYESSPPAVPSMLDVLKDMNKVKLRNVERSPGGTPARKRSKGSSCASDPASLIAEALKRKFAHRRRDSSSDKENHSAEPSPFSSPDTPRVPLFTRRSQGRNHSSPLTRGSDGKRCDGK
uniref:Mitochondrial fission regulator n=1 Tax=Ictalurus punctatus TaxID=7998 RepID=W5UGE5_ICTPU